MDFSGFVGFVTIESEIRHAVITVDANGAPTDADALPTYRIYGPSGFITSGSVALLDSLAITGASNASPTVITSVGHNLNTGMIVTISGILGNTGANGTRKVTVISSNTFSVPVDTSAGSAYSSGGTWHATGAYDFSYTPSVSNNFASGVVYSVVVYAAFSSTVNIVDEFCFQVT